MRDLVNKETKKHVEASQKPEYQPHGPGRTLAPWSEDQNKTLDKLNYVPPRNYFNEDDDWDNGQDDYPTSCKDIIESDKRRIGSRPQTLRAGQDFTSSTSNLIALIRSFDNYLKLWKTLTVTR